MDRKQWKKILRDQRSRKYAKGKKTNKKYNQAKKYTNYPNSKHEHSTSLYKEAITKVYTVPNNFSIINNPNETIEYFKAIYDGINKKLPGAKFIIDSSKVENATVDALVYLISIMENIKLIKSMKYIFSGNFPINNNAETVYKESGFIDYVRSKTKKLPNKSKMRIVSGTANLPATSKAVCDFIISELGVKKQDILFVQKILVELMSNSYYHAYNEKNSEIMYPKWYIYAEHSDDKIRIIFTDTGRGITGTIRRRLKERVLNTKDEELIFYAFQPGSFIRTETNLSHRGNGLPGIKDIVYDSPIQSFRVLSGKGGIQILTVNEQKELSKLHFKHNIYGTIIAFEF